MVDLKFGTHILDMPVYNYTNFYFDMFVSF